MKKIIPVLFVVFLIYGISYKDEVLIPDYAIRFRVIANSNSIEDQTMKYEVKTALESELSSLMLEARDVNNAKKIIEQKMSDIRGIVDNYTLDNKVSFGQNYFPEKEYQGVKYPSGEYSSLVITLGSGSGNNWWCVMFPPLCLLDAKNNGTKNTEYRFFVQDILNKYS